MVERAWAAAAPAEGGLAGARDQADDAGRRDLPDRVVAAVGEEHVALGVLGGAAGLVNDAAAAGPPSPCSPKADSDPAITWSAPFASAASRFALVLETYTVPLKADTPTGRRRPPPRAFWV